ncbi:hypothetical protein WR25_27088 [Diploscapter pachys]|uniref:PCI domain-containing protein n=1 Tax=Diploscapter pachys TaxID=2018661 RepID=A0A2A2JZI9_9BILA|nr:hypothetical protein WR25_27088 [Diploscapter pachys]
MSFDKQLIELREAVKGVERFNPANIELLEKCIDFMIKEQKYDREIVLNLLQLYQLNPNRYNKDYECLALLKALSQMPKKDFVLAKYLMIPAHRVKPEDEKTSPPNINLESVQMVINLGKVLEGNDFATFWKLVNEKYQPSGEENEPFPEPKRVKELIARCPGFIDNIKLFASESITNTFETVDTDILKRLLNANGTV